MRTNKYGVRGLKGVQLKRGFIYFWIPPLSLQKAGLFKCKTLGADFSVAVARARDWNSKLAEHRGAVNLKKPPLSKINPMTVAYLFRTFEASPRFARYAPRTRQDYSCFYREVETTLTQDGRVFGHATLSEVTRQQGYFIYERYILAHGNDSANKAMSACQAAFKYATLTIGELINPFSLLEKYNPPPRRQRWTDQQLDDFIRKAEAMGYPSIGRCALMCMELMQRPGDILSIKWGAFEPREKLWHIRQSKRGALVRIPETTRLRVGLNMARRIAKQQTGGNIGDLLVCPTVTGKRWHRHNFTTAVRRVARAAKLPDDLQIRDLRRTAATEGASAGATPAELMAVGGWVNQTSIRPYLVQTLEQAAAFQAKRDAYRRRQMGAGPIF